VRPWGVHLALIQPSQYSDRLGSSRSRLESTARAVRLIPVGRMWVCAGPGSATEGITLMARPPFKKDITPIGRGGVTKHVGKGASEMSGPGRGALTGGSPYARMANQYPKSTPADIAPTPASETDVPPPVPMGTPSGAGPQPSANMPSSSIGAPDEEA
jgi:hypothetical protein